MLESLVDRNSVRFDDLPQLIDKYARRCVSPGADEYYPILVAEAKKRLGQVWQVYNLVLHHYDESTSLRAIVGSLPNYEGSDPPPAMLAWIEENQLLELYSEVFYLIAWRLHEVVRLLPGLRGFRAPSIRTVRNHLLEHPEKHGNKTVWAFIVTDDNGPVLARAVPAGEELLDKGLWPNARELTDRLRRSLMAAISRAS